MKKLMINKKAKVQISAIGLVIVLMAVSIGGLLFVTYKSGMWDEWLGEDGTAGQTIVGPDGTIITPTVPSEAIRTGTAKWSIETVTTHTASGSSDTAYVGFCVADQDGYFDMMDYVEKNEMAAAPPDESTNFFSVGDEILMVVSSDNDATDCNETYNRWFYIESLDHGAYVKPLPKLNPISALTEYTVGGDYKYKVDGSRCETTSQKVHWYEAGDGSYWSLGTFTLYERLADENTIVQHISAGVVGATYNDGATFEDADSDIVANYTFTGDSQDIFLQLIGEEANGAWGVPTLAVTSAGQIKQYQGVIVFATDAVGIDTQPILDDGWQQMNKAGLTGDIAFYYVVNPFSEGCVPGSGDTLDLSVDITIDDSLLTASTEYEFEVWFLDYQCVQDVARGSTTASVPSGNGIVAEVGADAVSQPVAMTLSSGSAATPALMGHFTTNA